MWINRTGIARDGATARPRRVRCCNPVPAFDLDFTTCTVPCLWVCMGGRYRDWLCHSHAHQCSCPHSTLPRLFCLVHNRAHPDLEMPVDTIFEHRAFAFEPTDTVIDLGAGVGKPTALAVLEHGAASGIGVELSPTRFQAGCEALGRLAREVDLSNDVNDSDLVSIELQLGDVLAADLAGVSRVLIFATCFSGGLQDQLKLKLAAELEVGAKVFATGTTTWESTVLGTTSPGCSPSLVRRGSDVGTDVSSKVWTVEPCQASAV